MRPAFWTSATPVAQATYPLSQPGSLTALLARRGSVRVDVRFSGWQSARPDEAQALGLPAGRRVFVREVCLTCDDQPAVLARSLTTLDGIRGPWRNLRTLGRTPLAAIVWGDPRIRRSPFQFTRLPSERLPARRSCFWLKGRPLLVMEAFLDLPWPHTGWQTRRR